MTTYADNQKIRKTYNDYITMSDKPFVDAKEYALEQLAKTYAKTHTLTFEKALDAIRRIVN